MGQQPDSGELQKLQVVERHMKRCVDARKVGDWRSALREGDAAITAGADSSPQVKLLTHFLAMLIYTISWIENNCSELVGFAAFCM